MSSTKRLHSDKNGIRIDVISVETGFILTLNWNGLETAEEAVQQFHRDYEYVSAIVNDFYKDSEDKEYPEIHITSPEGEFSNMTPQDVRLEINNAFATRNDK